MRDAYFAPSVTVDACDAIGRISADTLAAYPPGGANILPGEEITADAIAYLHTVAASDTGHVRGALDRHITKLRVVTE